jgi:hypothetical protein
MAVGNDKVIDRTNLESSNFKLLKILLVELMSEAEAFKCFEELFTAGAQLDARDPALYHNSMLI